MTAFLALIGGVKGLAILALLIALGGYIAVLKHQATSAQNARDVAVAHATEIQGQLDKAIQANKDNEVVIANLNQEKQNINDALNTLQSAKDTNHANSQTRQVIITQGAGVPANAAQAAPVVGNMIQAVQSDRFMRRGLPDTQNAAPATSARIKE